VQRLTYNSEERWKSGEELFEEGLKWLAERICESVTALEVLGHPHMEDLDDEGLEGFAVGYAATEVEKIEEMERVRWEIGRKRRKCGALASKPAFRQEDFMARAGTKTTKLSEKFRAKVREDNRKVEIVEGLLDEEPAGGFG
jgi:hypothetical protein